MKKLIYTAVCMMTALALFGCSAGVTKAPENNQSEQNTENDSKDNDAYLESIKEYFPTDNLYRLYHGYAESGFEIRYEDFEENDDMAVFKYVGAMNDERGDESDERTFRVSYTVVDGIVAEQVENADTMAESSDNVYSKIKGLVVLSGAIEEGNSWEQEAELDGNKVVVKTTITEVTEDSFTTVTEAEAEGYKDGKYTEERTYTKGQGLTSFSNTPYGSDEDDTLIFGYSFSVANEDSVTGKITAA
ncbi:MAG: hypothetical protein PUD43_05650 [Clostridia bacterium]|nr:hypothetical protein [Clostridia bacterium]